MDPELLAIAQSEYHRQYDEWLKSEPIEDDFVETVEKIIKKYENYQSSTK